MRPIAEEDGPHCCRMLQGGPLATGVLAQPRARSGRPPFCPLWIPGLPQFCSPAHLPPPACLWGRVGGVLTFHPSPGAASSQDRRPCGWSEEGGLVPRAAGAITPNPTNTVRCGFTLTLPPCLWPLQWAPARCPHRCIPRRAEDLQEAGTRHAAFLVSKCGSSGLRFKSPGGQ